jgi:hypothetical protein
VQRRRARLRACRLAGSLRRNYRALTRTTENHAHAPGGYSARATDIWALAVPSYQSALAPAAVVCAVRGQGYVFAAHAAAPALALARTRTSGVSGAHGRNVGRRFPAISYIAMCIVLSISPNTFNLSVIHAFDGEIEPQGALIGQLGLDRFDEGRRTSQQFLTRLKLR